MGLGHRNPRIRLKEHRSREERLRRLGPIFVPRPDDAALLVVQHVTGGFRLGLGLRLGLRVHRERKVLTHVWWRRRRRWRWRWR